MVPCLYTKNSAKIHVEVLKYILFENPPFINKFIEKNQLLYRDKETLINNAKEDHERTKQFVKEYCEEVSRKSNFMKNREEERKNGNIEENSNSNKEDQEKNEKIEQESKINSSNMSTDTNTIKNDPEDKNKKESKQKSEAEILLEEEKYKKELREKIEEGFKTMKEIREKVLIFD